MEFWTAILGLLHRRRVIVPALLIAVAAGVATYLATPQVYTSDATMVLTTTEYGGTESQDPASPTNLTNPMLNFSDSLRTTSAILISAMGTRQVLEQLGATGGGTRLTINDGRTNPDLLGVNGPFLYIEARSGSAAEARRTVEDAQALTRQKLAVWQDELNAPERTFVNLIDVVPASAPRAGHGRAVKLGLMAFLLGFAACLGIAYAVDRIRDRRRARATSRTATETAVAAPDAEPGPPTEQPPVEVRPFRLAPVPVVVVEDVDQLAGATTVVITRPPEVPVAEQPPPFRPARNPMLKSRSRHP